MGEALKILNHANMYWRLFYFSMSKSLSLSGYGNRKVLINIGELLLDTNVSISKKPKTWSYTIC